MRYPGPRPAAVTAAATLGFAVGGLLVAAHLWTLLALFAYSRGGVAPADTGSFTAMYAVTACRVATGVLYLWGAVAALRGRTRVILVIAALLHMLFAAVILVSNRGHGAHGYGAASTALAVLDLLAAAPILWLIQLPSNRDFFAARPGRAR